MLNKVTFYQPGVGTVWKLISIHKHLMEDLQLHNDLLLKWDQ